MPTKCIGNLQRRALEALSHIARTLPGGQSADGLFDELRELRLGQMRNEVSQEVEVPARRREDPVRYRWQRRAVIVNDPDKLVVDVGGPRLAVEVANEALECPHGRFLNRPRPQASKRAE